ncbi:undecaprenyl-diphosphate phosphatase [Candidatus Roizmanbacteria bacterium]|nr:undecaprenyl-diphosphate phosphatase [Candidatus Roizmanbacteria bacterium]
MNIFHSIVLGLIEGLTEFLPISSTAHLIITAKLLHLSQTDFMKFFEVFIQSGAILAVVLLYSQYLLKHKALIKQIIFSFIPTAVIGLFLYKMIKNIFFSSNMLIIDAIFVVGLLFIILEYFISKKKIILKHSLSSLTPLQAVLTGLMQALAVIPGVSRSGIVMFYLMGQGYKRDEAATYSFLLAVPTILAASAYDLFKMRSLIGSSVQYLPLLLVGFITSFIVAYVVMKWFIGYLKQNSLFAFGIYRIALAIILLFVF